MNIQKDNQISLTIKSRRPHHFPQYFKKYNEKSSLCRSFYASGIFSEYALISATLFRF